MAGPLCLHYNSVPAITAAYLRILLARKSSFIHGLVPRIEAVVERTVVSPKQLERYRRVCGIREAHSLPITYPHVMATPLHLAMIASDELPVNLLGVVHTRNRIVQHRALQVDDIAQIRTWMEGHRETLRGQELDLHTQMSVAGAVVWSETATLLARRSARARGARTREAAMPALEVPPRQNVSSSPFVVAAGTGRRYARVSGDFNPIHLADMAARIFGFKRAIAHGMWTLARCAAEIGGPLLSGPCTLDVAFRRPITFGSRIALESWITDSRVGFALTDCDADRGHLLGSLSGS